MQKVGTISVTSVHEFFPTTVHIAWINERVQEKGAADGWAGGGTARVSLQIRTRQIENAKWGEELIARREKGRDERGSAKGKRRRLSGREV